MKDVLIGVLIFLAVCALFFGIYVIFTTDCSENSRKNIHAYSTWRSKRCYCKKFKDKKFKNVPAICAGYFNNN